MEPNFEEIGDAVDVVSRQEKKLHEMTFELVPDYLMQKILNANNLKWKFVKYCENNTTARIPDNKRGLYAFIVKHENGIFPPHGYVMYMGITERNLRVRYEEYINHSKIKEERPKVKDMFVKFHRVLYFFYCEVEDSFPSERLYDLETELIQALLPPANTRKKDRTKKHPYPGRTRGKGNRKGERVL